MMRRTMLGFLAGGIAALLGGCGGARGQAYRFRLTLEVETPAGLRRGSSVYAVAARYRAALDPSGKSRTWSVAGDALALDLPGGKTLFTLLKTLAIHQDMVGLSMATLDPAFRNDIVESAARIADGEGTRKSAEVAPANYPLLVTFADPADPTSVAHVDPADLAASFGSGVRLVRIVAEVTDDPMTTGIAKRLPWLKPQPEPRLDGSYEHVDDPTVAQQLHHGDFFRAPR